MTYAVYKYPLAPLDRTRISLPSRSRILSTGRDPGGAVCVWALVDVSAEPDTEHWEILVFGTGHPIPSEIAVNIGDPSVGSYMCQFVGTVAIPGSPLVWHIFARRVS